MSWWKKRNGAESAKATTGGAMQTVKLIDREVLEICCRKERNGTESAKATTGAMQPVKLME